MGPPRILIADDNPGMRERIATLLRSTCEVIGSVADGQAAFEDAVRLAPDVLIIDISLPVLNGLQVASRLRNLGCSARIIFLTAHEDNDYVEAAFSLGALGYVLKSRFSTDLVAAVEESLQGGRFTSRF